MINEPILLHHSEMLNGEKLEHAVNSIELVPPFLVDHLLPRGATLMLSSDGAVGKSTMTLNAAVAMSEGLPVWGQFACARPLRVMVVLGERTWREPVRRIRKGLKLLKPNFANLWITDLFSGTCNLLFDSDVDRLIAKVKEVTDGHLDVLILDPLYPFVQGALSEDKTGNVLTRQLTRIQRVLQCTIWFCHHNVKKRMTDKGKETRVRNPAYGSVWLFNHVTVQYAIEGEGPNEALLSCMKDNWGVLVPSIQLVVDPETELNIVKSGTGPGDKTAKVNTFLIARQADGTKFTRSEIIRETGVSAPHFYRLIADKPWAGRVENTSNQNKPAIYRVKPSFST